VSALRLIEGSGMPCRNQSRTAINDNVIRHAALRMVSGSVSGSRVCHLACHGADSERQLSQDKPRVALSGKGKRTQCNCSTVHAAQMYQNDESC
jgi:hypothetical protein